MGRHWAHLLAADFDAVVAACRDRGVRLLLDGVFNHAGRDFPPVAQALAEGPGSAAQDWVSQLYDTGGVQGPRRGPRRHRRVRRHPNLPVDEPPIVRDDLAASGEPIWPGFGLRHQRTNVPHANPSKAHSGEGRFAVGEHPEPGKKIIGKSLESMTLNSVS
ncbi:MAG TPA: alpha-amylase family glycosyl hydrolase [Propionibacteriaceae bacterium]